MAHDRITIAQCCGAIAAALLLAFSGSALAGKYVRVSPELTLHYEESGSGRPIIFIPGWTFTTRSMEQQVAHFSKRFRAISYDPRGQGKSSKTRENNHYTQHGADLLAFMAALKLKNVVIVGHSWGCQTTYAYFRAHGTENVKAFVCIDSPPKLIVEQEGDWGLVKAAAELKPYHDGTAYARAHATREFLQSMVTRPLKPQEIQALVDESMKTPTSIALQLDYDANMADYTAEARAIDGKVPVLNVLADPGWYDGWTAAGRAWVGRHAPHSEVEAFGLHLLHWEFPERFNAAVDAFLERALR
ncbi:MAG: alpha/beta hydrolase [Burkholderiales bacterium]|nr:alpha/beta hydrolase [Burkholderiales bacterium]